MHDETVIQLLYTNMKFCASDKNPHTPTTYVYTPNTKDKETNCIQQHLYTTNIKTYKIPEHSYTKSMFHTSYHHYVL